MIKIITVGQMKKGSLLDIMNNYTKQMSIPLKIIEVKDEATKEGIEIEAKRITDKLAAHDYVILLAIEGAMYDSISFAKKYDQWVSMGKDIVIIIGGSYGVSQTIYDRAHEKISFSKMTFPHQLMRVILVEQLYRAQMILKNHPYHK